MKISNEIKRNQLPSYVTDFLSFIPTINIKSGIFALTFILLDIVLLPLLYPKIDIIYYITIPLIVFIHLWAIRLLFKNPYTIQFESVLYLGILGAVGTFCYFILTQKMAYFNLNITSLGYYFVSTITYLICVIILVLYQIKKYSSLEPKKKSKPIIKYGSAIAVAPAFGYIFAQFIMGQSEHLMEVTMYVCSSLFSLLLAYIAAKFIYKYFFMKTNIHLVVYQKPPKKFRREFQEKGIKIR